MSNLWTNDFMEIKRQEVDPVADEMVAQIVEQKGKNAAKSLFDELIRNVEMPLDERFPGIDEFVSQTAVLPEWADFDKIALANQFFKDHGPKLLIFLYHKSLPTLYVDANGAKVLAQTRRLAHDEQSKNVFARRVAETGQFLLDVMCKDALKPGGNGITAVLKIRLIHASIRNFIPESHWDSSVLGRPINQEDLALTLMSFSVLLLEGLDAFGIDYSREESEAYIHIWNVIGYLLGITEDLLPADKEDAQKLVALILERQARSSSEGIMLTQALLEFTKSNIPFTKLENTSVYLIRYLIGDEYAQMLKVIPEEGCISILIPVAMKKLFKIGEKLEDRISQPLRYFIDEFSEIAAKKFVEYFDEYKKRNFVIPEEFAKAWF